MNQNRYQRWYKRKIYQLLDRLYLPLDKDFTHRTQNIRLIPLEPNRKGGKYAYAEWAHVIGIFQTIIQTQLKNSLDIQILDIGCGTGLVGIACEPFLGLNGKYTGIDVIKDDIRFCQNHFPSRNYSFIHLDVANPFYAPTQQELQAPWPLDDECMDLVTALSVWTHFNENDAFYYLNEVARVLRPGGKAIITFFLLDNKYLDGLSSRNNQTSAYHKTRKDRWIFDQPAYGSENWLHPIWAETPEEAIGITKAGFKKLNASTCLQHHETYQGNWKEIPGIYFQDIVVFSKPAKI